MNDGAIDASAVAQAQTQLESTRTQDSDIDVQRTQLQHAIATEGRFDGFAGAASGAELNALMR